MQVPEDRIFRRKFTLHLEVRQELVFALPVIPLISCMPGALQLEEQRRSRFCLTQALLQMSLDRVSVKGVIVDMQDRNTNAPQV